MQIPALERGLAVVDHLIRCGKAQSLAALRATFPQIPLASLTRLLSSLVENGALAKEEHGRYVLGPRVQAWAAFLVSAQTPEMAVSAAVERLSRATRESAGYVVFREGRLVTLCSCMQEGSIHIMPTGTTLHYEADHAAALAWLESLSVKERKEAIAAPVSKIDSVAMLNAALVACRREGYFADVSEARPGVSRLAVRVRHSAVDGVLFLCLTTTRCQMDEATLAAQLLVMQKELQEADS